MQFYINIVIFLQLHSAIQKYVWPRKLFDARGFQGHGRHCPKKARASTGVIGQKRGDARDARCSVRPVRIHGSKRPKITYGSTDPIAISKNAANFKHFWPKGYDFFADPTDPKGRKWLTDSRIQCKIIFVVSVDPQIKKHWLLVVVGCTFICASFKGFFLNKNTIVIVLPLAQMQQNSVKTSPIKRPPLWSGSVF